MSLLEKQLNCDVTIGMFKLGFPKKIIVKDVLISNNSIDTLVFLGDFSVDIKLLPLLNGSIVIKEMVLKDMKGDLGRFQSQMQTVNSNNSAVKTQENDNGEFKIILERLSIENSFLKYKDEQKTFGLIMDIGEASLATGAFNFDTLIAVNSFDVSDSKISFTSFTGQEDTTEFVFPIIFVEAASVKNSSFAYIDSTGKFLFYAGGKMAKTSDIEVDINKEAVNFSKAFAGNIDCYVAFYDQAGTLTDDYDYLNWGQYLWRVTGNKFKIENSGFDIDFIFEPDRKNFNSSHLHFRNINGMFTDFTIDEDTLTMEINNLSGFETHGLNITLMKGNTLQKGKDFFINNLYVKSGGAEYIIDLKTGISPTDYLKIKNRTFDLTLQVKADNLNDIEYFYPLENLNRLKSDCLQTGFDLYAGIAGTTDSINIKKILFSTCDSTEISLNGFAGGFIDDGKASYFVEIERMTTAKGDINSIIELQNDSLFPLPAYMEVNGNLEGEGDLISFTGHINSDIGNVKIERLEISQGRKKQYSTIFYAGLHNLQNMTDSGIEKIFLKCDANFSGSGLYNGAGSLTMIVDSLGYNGYVYHDINVDSRLAKNVFNFNLNSDDSIVPLLIKGDGTVTNNRFTANLIFNTGKIDFMKAGLSNTAFQFLTRGNIKLNYVDTSTFGMSLNVDTLDFWFSDTIYKMHPAGIVFQTGEDSTHFKLNSFFYHLYFSAEGKATGVVEKFIRLPGYYLSGPEKDSAGFDIPQFVLQGNLNYPEAFMRIFFPGFPAFENLTVNGAYDRNKDLLSFRLLLPGMSYGEVYADTFDFKLDGSSNGLNFLLGTGFKEGELMSGKMRISGAFDNSELITNVTYLDSYFQQYLNLTVCIDTSYGGTVIKLLPDSLIFSYDKWEVNPENKVIAGNDKIIFEDFVLKSDKQGIKFINLPDENKCSVQLELDKFNLGSLENLFALDTVVSGIADAKFNFIDIFGNPEIIGTLSISDMNLYDFKAGKLELTNFVFNDSLFKGVLKMTGEKEDVLIAGRYSFFDKNDPVNVHIKLNSFDISDLNYILSSYIRDAKGKLNGELIISGSAAKPVANGFVSFDNAGVGIISLNNYFTLGNEKITIADNQIDFAGLSIKNKKGQSAKVTGTISLGNNSSAYSDLKIISDNMEIMNSTAKDNPLFFGLIGAKTGISVKGTPEKTKVRANIEILKSSDVTYIFPDDLYVNDNSGIVRFGRYSVDTTVLENDKENGIFYSLESFKDVKVEIEIEKGAHFKLFFDKTGSDYLNANIGGNMIYTVYEGNTGTSGMFNIESGKLHYSIPMVTVEDFTIEPGSYFTLSNDIYNPYLNIIASADIRASTATLMQDYNKVMTFKVLLYMVGELNNLKLRFDISTQTDDAIVSARLSQLTEEERNINALNLLVRGSFVISMHGDGAGSSTMLSSQMDKFWASQLNHLISDNVRFVDLQFDVQSYRDYNSSGGQVFKRNYYYTIGKSFLHNRVRISYKGSLDFSSSYESDQINSSFVQNALEIEYKITENGTFRAVLFRKDQYEGLLEGEILETGGGLKIKKRFYSIGDMFTGSKRREKGKKEQENGK